MAAEAAVSLAVETLGDLLIQKAVFLRGVEGDVVWVRKELKRMQCFLKDAAAKQSQSSSIRNWISEIREVAHDAEDAIEKFVLNAHSTRGLLERFTCFPNHVHRLYIIGKEIESIRKRLKGIESSRLSYGIQSLGESSRTRSELQVESRRRLAYWLQDSDVVGLEKDVELLLQRAILKERRGLSVASILGMGGIGKSTLARKIYNHPRIGGGFECRAWVVVSSEFTTEDIMKQILVQLGISLDRLKLLESVDDVLRRLQNLQEELHKRLSGKRYLIVLDDVWEATDWESLRPSFPDQDNTSRLLLTSRNKVMEEYSQFVHNMKVLDINQSWKLFMKKTFMGNGDGKCPEELHDIGKEILKWCGGLPLAISVVGGLLQKKTPCKSDWEKLVKEMKSHLNRNESINTISAILELSYHNLPPELKACFLSLGLFKEDDVINVENLVHVWVAQGLVAQEVVGEEETMEDVATDYLNQLIIRNMVQVMVMNCDHVKYCHMHDLLRDLSQRKAEEEINMEILIREEGDSHHSLHKPRHRAIHYNWKTLVLSTNRNQHLRSLFIHGRIKDIHMQITSYWKSCELLKGLDLGNAVLAVLPKAIGGLTGLRYIKMRHGEGEFNLPRSWGKLTNLQILDLRCNLGFIIIDKVLTKMESLRHLYARISPDPKVSLRNMRNLQTLSLFPIKNSSLKWLVRGMGGVTTLELNIRCMFDPRELFTNLARLGNLVCLTLKHLERFINMDGLAALHGITKLKLANFDGMYMLPTNFPPKLSYLTLSNMSLTHDPMLLLERLPKLLYLELCSVRGGGAYKQIGISHHGFPSLKVLRLRNINSRSIQVEKGGLPVLKQLFVHNCQHLNIENLPVHGKSAIIDD